jgi:bifunctional DNA-binding transcriptional regulator/antitoxin component of YhaV-PrlF toxin-antitoxin module
MVDSRERYGIAEGSSYILIEEKDRNEESSIIIEISLIEFDADATMEFVNVLTILWHHRLQLIIPERVSRHTSDEMDESIANTCKVTLIDEGKISEQNIVECLRLAHYLQCRVILTTLTTILESSIDSRNCMAICSLADSLNLKSLFEASINYVIERLDAFQGTTTTGGVVDTESITSDTSGDDDTEVWSSLPHELRSRIMTMRNVMRSSVIGRGSKVSGLFFSSGAEFLAIFRETIREQNERLQEAMERCQEVIRERTEQWHRRGRWLSDSETDFINGGEVAYCLEKIENQSRRLKTLEKFYDEQKTIFEGSSFESGIIL